MSFSELNLKSELVDGLKRLKLENPTEVQEKAVPILLTGKDLIVRSKTGSGKTFAFLLPILNNLSDENKLQALVLAPTRELAVQIDKEVHKLDKHISSVLLYGGVGIGPQIDALDGGAQIAVATPGRILDHMERGTIDFSFVRFVVLDEADRMLDMGFIDDVEKILRATPKNRQTMLFSATMPEKIQELSARYMNEPALLMLQQDEITVKKIRQQVLGVDRKQKLDLLLTILKDKAAQKVMIFANTKDWAERLGMILWKKRFNATSIHSGLSQNKRNHVIQDFNAGRHSILVATDVAARGLHIENVTHVINYDIPRNPKDYVHRIGRTGRAGKEGDAITFVTQIDEQLLRGVEGEIKTFLEVQYVGQGGAPLVRPEPVAHKDAPDLKPIEHVPHAGEMIKVHAHVPESSATGDDWGLD
ncbi:DEAD/DEAH box helicase [Candidatus Woesearchaeota archaeon]|nr:DEAD/DEAH box helicase [Candidatus Woesearchaeota archaeon]